MLNLSNTKLEEVLISFPEQTVYVYKTLGESIPKNNILSMVPAVWYLTIKWDVSNGYN